jgi:hypothetical protein
MYRQKRLEFKKNKLLVNALIMRARFNRMYVYKIDRVKTYLKNDEL